MKVKVDREIRGLTGEGMKVVDGEGNFTGEIMTLRSVCVGALIFPGNNEKVSAMTKYGHKQLAEQIYNEDVTDLGKTDIAELKKLINKAYTNPLIIGYAFDMLDEEVEETEKKDPEEFQEE